MGDIHTLPTGRDAAARLLERIVIDTIESCPDRRVAERWAQLAKKTTAKYVSPPNPTQQILEFPGLAHLDDASRRQIAESAAAWMESYFGDVRGCMMAMHRDLLSAQKHIAELEVEIEDREKVAPHSRS